MSTEILPMRLVQIVPELIKRLRSDPVPKKTIAAELDLDYHWLQRFSVAEVNNPPLANLEKLIERYMPHVNLATHQPIEQPVLQQPVFSAAWRLNPVDGFEYETYPDGILTGRRRFPLEQAAQVA